jgi:hypothetical protein
VFQSVEVGREKTTFSLVRLSKKHPVTILHNHASRINEHDALILANIEVWGALMPVDSLDEAEKAGIWATNLF